MACSIPLVNCPAVSLGCCPGCSPFQPLAHPSLLPEVAEWGTEKALTPCKHSSATPKTLVCYQHSYSDKPAMYGLRWSNECHPSQTQHAILFNLNQYFLFIFFFFLFLPVQLFAVFFPTFLCKERASSRITSSWRFSNIAAFRKRLLQPHELMCAGGEGKWGVM